jgi:fimbrial isopeptide formation D2 family protein
VYSSYSNIQIYCTKKPTVVLGDTICASFIAEIKPGDLDPSNNIYSTCGIVVNSYDPNYKEVSPAYEIDSNATLDYTIHFQNTGNDTAYKVILTDTIDSNLDLSTLNIKGGSHNFSTNVYDNRLLAFTFDQILLPDSGANQLASNGFVSYSIKVKSGTPIGTHISNKAYIFFDTNQPIITNATDNVIVAITAINELTIQDEISVYPNPTNDNVTVKSNQPLNNIKVFNMMGELVYNTNGTMKTETIIPFQNFAKGVYTIIIESKNKSLAKKVIKI